MPTSSVQMTRSMQLTRGQPLASSSAMPHSADPVESLTASLDVIDRQVADLEAELADLICIAASAAPDDEHDVEGASIGFERARVSALLDHSRQVRGDLQQALARHGAGEFGMCCMCGGAIAQGRLSALPAVKTCMSCATGAGGRLFRALGVRSAPKGSTQGRQGTSGSR